MTFVGGYTVFLPGMWSVSPLRILLASWIERTNFMTGAWDVPTFLFSYAMVGVFPIIFIGWKTVKKTKWLKPHEVILRTQEVEEIEEYTRNYVERPPKTRWHAYVDKIFS